MPSKAVISNLTRFGTVYSSTRGLDHAYLQKEAVTGILNHLTRSAKKSFILLGPSGAGKTAILHEVFRKLIKSPEKWTVVQTSTTELLAGTKYIGEWQTRVTDFLSLAKASQKVLIYVTDIHNLHGAGRAENDDSNMAESFAPLVESKKNIIAGEATPSTYRAGIEQIPALQRHLTTFKIAESNREETAAIVRACFKPQAAATSKKLGVRMELPEPSLNCITDYGDIYFPNDALPGGAIRLLDHVVSKCIESAGESPPDDGILPVLQADVVQALEIFTGVPRRLLDDSIPLDPAEMRQFFDARVIGQNTAVSTVCDLITLIKAGLTDPGKPLGVLLFAGPTGVGKTELAKALAEFLFGSSDRLIRCDMSEYKDPSAFEKLIGLPGYTSASQQSNSLIARVRQQPFSVILLDEIEKAHPNVFDVLLQAFDDGRLTDPNGNTTNLTQTIMVMTSNLGGNLATPSAMGFGATGPDLATETDKALRQFFRPEFLNRLDHILQFNPLGREDTRTLARRELGRAVLRSGLTRRELRVDIDPSVIDILVRLGFSEIYGARPLRRAVEQHALLPVAKQIVQMGEESRGSLLRLTSRNRKIVAEVVRDRQTRTAARISRGVEVEDTSGTGTEKVRPQQIAAEVEQLAQIIAELETRASDDALTDRKSELVERSGEADFWDDPQSARRTLSDIYRIERLLDAINHITGQQASIAKAVEFAEKKNDARVLARAVGNLRAAQLHAELVLFGIECNSPEDRRDAFISIHLVGTESEQDLVADLARSYARWAKRKRYDVHLVHEEKLAADRSLTGAITLEISGPAAFGIFRSEDGLHEFAFGKTASLPRRLRHVSLRVIAAPNEREQQESAKIDTRSSPAKKWTGALGHSIKTRATASLGKSKKSLTIISPLDPDPAADTARRLLLAEATQPDRPDPEVVRKYTISPRQSVRDPNAPNAAIKLQEFWNGHIDSLLRAGIESRT